MKALILVNIQNDYMPDGVVPVPDADAVIPVANRLAKQFSLVVATQVWHPPDHLGFANQHPGRHAGESIHLADSVQTLWPDHCVRETEGAAFPDRLKSDFITHIFRMGTSRSIDAHSAFFDRGEQQSTGLGEFLKDQRAVDLFVLGVATDTFVRHSVLDAVRLGFFVTVIKDGCRGFDRIPGDSRAALDDMRAAGAKVVSSRSARTAMVTQ